MVETRQTKATITMPLDGHPLMLGACSEIKDAMEERNDSHWSVLGGLQV
jgi:hypothetical protein